jgi:hypothetical protein
MATGDKKQIYIFDIDSALDHLENELNEENTATIQSQYQKNEVSKHRDQEIKSTEPKEEENGNISTSVNNNSNELISASEQVTSISIDNNKETEEEEGDEREYLKFIDSRREKKSIVVRTNKKRISLPIHSFSLACMILRFRIIENSIIGARERRDFRTHSCERGPHHHQHQI